MIIEALVAHLRDDAAVAAFVAERIYPHVLPQGAARPALTYTMDADDLQPLVDGDVSSLREARFDLRCWSLSHLESHRLALAIEDSLLGVHGAIGAQSPPLIVDTVRFDSKFDLFESDTKLYRVSLLFSLAYYQS